MRENKQAQISPEGPREKEGWGARLNVGRRSPSYFCHANVTRPRDGERERRVTVVTESWNLKITNDREKVSVLELMFPLSSPEESLSNPAPGQEHHPRPLSPLTPSLLPSA